MIKPQNEMTISLQVNGENISEKVDARMHLVDFLREKLQLKGSHLGCEHGVCGACTVMLNGEPVRGCLVLAVQADGSKVETIEGLTQSGVIADLQAAFVARNALQCGYCTSGMLVTLADFIKTAQNPSREEIRTCISGNYCRCTGYEAIVDAVETTLKGRAA